MPELTSLQDAENTVNRLFKIRGGTAVNQTYLDDYAQIAWFFTQRNLFEAALGQLSAKLWDNYRGYQEKFRGHQKHLFTTALRELAGSYGWQFGSNLDVLLVGAVSAQQYETWARQGLFFKDDMDLKHGEHTHTFQWLVVAMQKQSLGLKNAPHDLYKSTFDVMPQNNQKVTLPGFKNSSGAEGPGEYSLWSFVADCFPTSMAAGQAMPQGDSLFGDTYRTPQVVMKYLLDQAPVDHFIAAYLLNRYKKRSWVSGQPGARYTTVSGGATVKNIAVQEHSNAPGWTAVQGASGPSAFTQVVTGPQFRTEAKETIQVKYHGQTGLINKEE
jgi:Family of unknown function (DUF5636)